MGPCGVASTTLQPKPAAEPKKAVSAKSAGRRSSRAAFSSSTKIKKLIYCLQKNFSFFQKKQLKRAFFEFLS
jgi:hypothetical protein